MPCDILTALPPELVIEVFAFLDPASLTRCTAVNKGWRNLVANDLLWRKVATEQLCLCPPTIQVQDLATLPSLRRWSASDHLANLTSFRQLCVRWEQVLLGWRGRCGSALNDDDGDDDENDNDTERDSNDNVEVVEFVHPSQIRKIQAISKFIPIVVPDEGQLDVWRIKVDPEEGTLIATTRKGGLYVLDIKTSQVLWQLGIEQVGAYEHLEGERGILVISNTRQGGEGFNVWVHRRLVPDGGNGELYQCRSTLRPSQRSHASRLKWPVFCAMGFSGTAFFWDLSNPEQPRQLMSIDVSTRYGSWEVKYIDFDDQHLFLVGREFGAVTVYNRATGQVKWSLDAYLRQTDAHSLVRFYKLDIYDFRRGRIGAAEHRSSPFELREQQLLAERHLNDELELVIDQLSDITADRDDRLGWIAIHPDEATGALLVLGQTMLAIIPDFASLSESNCRTPIMMIEYTDGGHRVPPYAHAMMQFSLAVADGRAFMVGGYPIVLDLVPQRKAPLTPGSAPFQLPEDTKDSPPLRVFASYDPFLGLADYVSFAGCSCAQMDAANIFAVLEAPVYPDAEDEADFQEAWFEVLHWRIDGA